MHACQSDHGEAPGELLRDGDGNCRFTLPVSGTRCEHSAATSSSYTTPATVSGDNGARSAWSSATRPAARRARRLLRLQIPRPVAPSITTQPANQTVTAGQTATFSVVAAGTAPLTLSVAEKQREYLRRDLGELHNAATVSGDNGATFPRDGHQLREQHHKQFGDLDGDPASRRAEHHHAARQSDGDRRDRPQHFPWWRREPRRSPTSGRKTTRTFPARRRRATQRRRPLPAITARRSA